MSANPTQFRHLEQSLVAGADRVQDRSTSTAPASSESHAESTSIEPTRQANLGLQIASMAVLLVLGVVASVALLKTRKRIVAINGPELGARCRDQPVPSASPSSGKKFIACCATT